ncbi:hypothetical protein [Micromonospora sp. WMMD1155]|uniref:hypothetical protein n=1 Tax=Micromonospora sp. WMMD1155 TaxID=3016094 RepID=UPI00249BC60B|nr:hypothetical protein [Micromonospora sp. WMMD1155]WFE49468.1 hypothetical protein O7617_03620 [Micromonospora sp. WMMD1155]
MRSDERAERYAYNQQPLAAILLDLERNADRFVALTSEIREPQWSRTAVRLPWERRTVLWVVRQVAHEGLHHLHDIGAGTNDKAVSFDVDGVLVDSYPACRRIWSRWPTTATSTRTWSGRTPTAAGPSTPSRPWRHTSTPPLNTG